MEGYQLIYSACKTGINHTGNGFQIYSHTQNIPKDFSSNEGIGKICKYKAPVDLPSAPTEEEINTLFPISCTYGKLNGEKRFFSRNKYIGLDNTGHRYGNFISHAICFSDIEDYPVCAIPSGYFYNDLPEQEKNRDTVPDYLDSVDLDKIFADNDLSVEDVSNFLWEAPDRIYYLKMMINAVFEYFSTGKRILLCDEKENIPLWIAGITRAFPVYIAKDITFTTYAFDPVETDCVICGVAPAGTAYSVQTARSYGIFQIFDFQNEYYSEVQAEGNYVDAIEVGYTISPAILDDLFQYMKYSNYTIQTGYSKCLYDSYQIYRGNGKKLTLTEVQDVLQYIYKNSDAAFAKEFFEAALKHFEEDLDASADFIYVYVKYAMLLAGRLGDDALYESVCSLYWIKVLALVNDYKMTGIESIGKLHEDVLSVRQDCRSRIDAAMLGDKVGNAVSLSLEKDVIEFHNIFWMQHILDYIVRTKLTLHSFAEKYDSKILRTIYYNLQIMPDPAGAIRELAGNLPLCLIYELYGSLFEIFDNTLIRITLHRDLYRRILRAEDRDEFQRKAILFALKEIKDPAYIEKMVSAFDETVSLKTEKELDMLETCLQTLKEIGYPCNNTKVYTVWILREKLFVSGSGYKADMSAMKECNLSLLNESEREYIVKKAFEVWGSRLIRKTAHRKLLDALYSMGEELWMLYGICVIEMTEKNPEVFASYFEYLCDVPDKADKTDEAYEAVFNLLVLLSGKQLARIRTATAPHITKSLQKEYKAFMDSVEATKRRTKDGIMNRLKGIFAGKDNR